ncbi:hypothetical protein NDU88_005794 [Pleurodeles waltl]|uniref:Uncharacterized protein n=1 Tax=Pleurodeles waltl TaxID=8319 RepID=A0AAV7QJ96_PLEWA|nr:hypothetical protein NDU88_005794 [Pleurodeles waltl]
MDDSAARPEETAGIQDICRRDREAKPRGPETQHPAQGQGHHRNCNWGLLVELHTRISLNVQEAKGQARYNRRRLCRKYGTVTSKENYRAEKLRRPGSHNIGHAALTKAESREGGTYFEMLL